MSVWSSWVIADIINSIVFSSPMLASYLKINKKVNKVFWIKYILFIIIFAFISNLLLYNAPKMTKTVIKILLSSALLHYVFEDGISKILMQIFLIYILFAIYDTLFGLMYIGIFQMPTDIFNNNAFFIVLVNIVIAILAYFTINMKKVLGFIENIAEWYSSKSIVNVIGNIILCVISLWFFINKNTSGETPLYEYIINFGVIILIIVFVIGFFKENSDKNRLKKKYDTLIGYAKTYEQEVVEKSKWQHEYQNQLLMIRDKVKKEDPKKTIEYIDELLEERPKDENTQWLIKLSKFPDIGIKGLLHYKICQLKELGVSVYVDVESEMEITDSVDIVLEQNLQDISRVLGVYIDNAIHAACEATKKYLIFEFKNLDSEIVFQISNTYEGNLDIEKMNQDKFTTKGQGHGNGLSLARDILEKNERLSQEREINGMYFVQKLIIDTK